MYQDRVEGYTLISLISGYLHKPSYVLFFHKEFKEYYLLGQDEGTYFGVILSEKVNSIKEASTSLIPKEVGNRENTRQGEWFVVEYNKEMDGLGNVVYIARPAFDDIYEGLMKIHLPVENDKSNVHVLQIDKHDSRINIYRNNALRSVSEKGVD